MKKILKTMLVFQSILACLAIVACGCGSSHSRKSIYSKLTPDLFDKIPDEELETAILENIWSKMKSDMGDDYEVIQKLSKPRRAFYIVFQVESEVMNGGFNQFYFNSSGRYADQAEEAFELIGGEKYRDLMKKANLVYSENKRKITKKQDGTTEGFSKSYENNPLNGLDDEFYELEKAQDLSQLKIAFIRKNKAAFTD